jgi:hypothetical protein
VVVRRRSLIFIYIGPGPWHRFNLERWEEAALELVAREEGALVLGQEVEQKRSDRRLYLDSIYTVLIIGI